MVSSMDATVASQRTTGLDLKLARIARGVSQRELARRLEVSPQRIAAIEAARWPTEPMRARYASGLDAIRPGASASMSVAAGADQS